MNVSIVCIFFFQAEDGIRDLVRSRGLGDVYKRQTQAMLGQKVNPSALAASVCPRGTDEMPPRMISEMLSLIHI